MNPKLVVGSKSKPLKPHPLKPQVNNPLPSGADLACLTLIFFAAAAQPTILEALGVTEEARTWPAPGGEIENAPKGVRLTGDDLGRVREMIRTFDKFALVRVNCPASVEHDRVVYLGPPEMGRI
jgi:hypothetical protein